MRIMIVEDEEIQRVSLEDDLAEQGFEVRGYPAAAAALAEVETWIPDVVLTDLRMPDMDGLQFMRELRVRGVRAKVIVMTAFSTVETAVEAMRLGATDYLTKPFPLEELILRLRQVEHVNLIEDENRLLKEQLRPRKGLDRILGESLAMVRLRDQVAIAASGETTILLEGETGTGKDLVAEVIHSLSPRSKGPLVKVSCALFAPEVLESELFGHEQGAFTGATRRRLGRFEMASGGTLYLDEVDDMPLAMQVKLLRVLEDRVIERVGGSRAISVDVRVIAATKRNLVAMVEEGAFRRDLFYRLNVYPLTLPPVRAHTEDVPLLLRHFIQAASGKEAPPLTPEAEACLRNYDWPGNIRQVRNEADRLLLSCHCNPLVPHCFSAEIQTGGGADPGVEAAGQDCKDLNSALAEFEIRQLTAAMAKAGGNKAEAARLLGIPATTLKSKLKKFNLDT